MTGFMASVLESVVLPIGVVDHAGLLTFANPAALAALGYQDASDLVGRSGHETIHHKRPDGTGFPVGECTIARTRTTGQTVHAEDWLVRRDGSLFPVAYWLAPIAMPGGPGAVFAFIDVSQRGPAAEARATELVASEARQRAILEAALDGVISIDGEARITYVNTAIERMFGYQAVDLIGRELADVIIPPSLRDPHRRGFARYLATGEARILDRRIEITAMRGDGSEFPVELAITRTGPPEAPAFTGHLRDITERRRAEQELTASRARLVTAFDAARQQVTRDLHDGAQQRLISTIIRLQLARQKWESEPPRARELLDLALDDAKHAIDELRDLAAGIHPTILSQRGLAAALAALSGRLAVPVELDLPEHRLPGTIEASAYFFCSEALTNVVKHAQASTAWVRIAVSDDRYTIEVRDDGIGGASARSDGSGLTGLRDRIGALNGTMDILSPAEGGTVLRAWIPRITGR
jgi:PAS domain S-box-containing protein